MCCNLPFDNFNNFLKIVKINYFKSALTNRYRTEVNFDKLGCSAFQLLRFGLSDDRCKSGS